MATISMDGRVSAPEGSKIRADMVRRQSMTMEYFLESRKLDEATADMLLKYDKDGNGVFSKDEVAAIIIDLRSAMMHNEELAYYNKLFKRLLLAAILFAIFLLSGMFCLSYVVAVMTANTQVQSNGIMMTKDGSAVIATDSIAYSLDIGNHEGGFCIPGNETEMIKSRVSEGRNVLLHLADSESGNKTMNHLKADGMQYRADGTVCFWNQAVNDYSCLIPAHDGCVATDHSGRRLSHSGIDLHDAVLAHGVCITEPYCAEVCGCNNGPCTCGDPDFNNDLCIDIIGNFDCTVGDSHYYCEKGTKC